MYTDKLMEKNALLNVRCISEYFRNISVMRKFRFYFHYTFQFKELIMQD